jgi:uncharacterized membrane protein YdcZ (DUF606 family)
VLILTEKVVASGVIDHLGLIRVPVHEASLPRVVGALQIVAGIAERF